MAPATRATPRSSRFGWVRAITSDPSNGGPTNSPSPTERATVRATPTSRERRAVSTSRSRPCRVAKAAARSGSIHAATSMAPMTTAPLLASNPRVAIRPAATVSTRSSWSARASSSNGSGGVLGEATISGNGEHGSHLRTAGTPAPTRVRGSATARPWSRKSRGCPDPGGCRGGNRRRREGRCRRAG